MMLASERVLKNARTWDHKKKKEFVRFFTLRDDQETIAEARAIYSEYVGRMRRLIAKADQEQLPSEGVRFVGIVVCSLVTEDFV